MRYRVSWILAVSFVFLPLLPAQIVAPTTTGMVAPAASGAGVPTSVLTCNAASANILFLNTSTNQLSICNPATSAWTTPADPSATATAIGGVKLAAGQTATTLSTVATTGAYSDLSGKPTLTNGTVTAFAVGTWPSWLTPSLATPTTTPTLGVASSAIPNSALANSSVTVGGATCTLGSSCTPLNVTYYNAAGVISARKCWQGNVTSTTAGAFTASIASASFTTVDYVNASVKSTAATAAGSGNANIVTNSLTTITGTVTIPLSIIVGGLGVVLSSTAQTVWVEACGT